jgi:transposase-like protein
MIVKIICPSCRAGNELSASLTTCRRCREDLSLLYAVKAYSYKARLHALKELAENEIAAARYWARTAQRLDKSV